LAQWKVKTKTYSVCSYLEWFSYICHCLFIFGLVNQSRKLGGGIWRAKMTKNSKRKRNLSGIKSLGFVSCFFGSVAYVCECREGVIFLIFFILLQLSSILWFHSYRQVKMIFFFFWSVCIDCVLKRPLSIKWTHFGL
jgi:hypothetical protein